MFLLRLMGQCISVCVTAWGCVRWWRLRRHGWREWTGVWGIRVGRTEENQSYSFAGRGFQRYTNIHAQWFYISQFLTEPAPWLCPLRTDLALCLFCSSITLSHPVQCGHWWTWAGSCVGTSGLVGLSPHKLLRQGKENTFSWAIDLLVCCVCLRACVCGRVCVKKCNYRSGWENWSLGSVAAVWHKYICSSPT